MKIGKAAAGGLAAALAPTLLAGLVNFGCNSQVIPPDGAPNPDVKYCDLIGCTDHFRATVTSGASGFPMGMHQIDVTADGATLSCTFTFPLPKLPTGGDASPQCSPGLMVMVQTAPGDTKEVIDLPGNPMQVRVRQLVDGAVVLDMAVTPVYGTDQPNGPGCDPICHEAGADWMIAAIAVRDGGSE
jgi:hypothetical protein